MRVLDNFSSGRQDNLKDVVGRIDLVEGDIRDAAACRAACEGIDTVFHMAALVSVPHSVADPIGSDAINSGGTLNVLVAARDSGVKRLVCSSSVAIYGDTAVVWFTQTMTGPSQGRTLTLMLRYIDVFVFRAGKWQCVASQSTKVNN